MSRRTKWIMSGSLLILLAVGAVAIPASMPVHWIGWQSLSVTVIVYDLNTGTPVSGAVVELIDVETVLDSDAMSVSRRVAAAAQESNVVMLRTNAGGMAECEHRFHAAGTAGLLSETGYIDTGATCVRITAPGHSRVISPINGHSNRPRDIHDRSPVLIEVFLDADTTTREDASAIENTGA